MPRKVARSTKQRKAQLQEKRAVKRGDLPPPPTGWTAAGIKKLTNHAPRPGQGRSGREGEGVVAEKRKLVSKFLPLTPEYIAKSKTTALTDPLPRPIADDAPFFPLELLEPAQALKEQLSIPRRPKWRYGQTKNEVEANEAGLFKKWLAGADAAVEKWRAVAEPSDDESGSSDGDAQPTSTVPTTDEPSTSSSSSSSSIQWPRSTTYFERNLEVYRQLWRTLELSPILLVLIDIRCPPLHFPPSLQEYILSHQQTSKKEVVLVLTKCDLVPPDVRKQWEEWCRREWGRHGWDIVSLEAYRREKRAQGTRSVLKSYIPPSSLVNLVEAIKRAHQRLITPPAAVAQDPAKLAKWTPRVRAAIDWDKLVKGLPVEGETTPDQEVEPRPVEKEESTEGLVGEGPAEHLDLNYLTVGLIGQPNVGKSSLLNAMVGKSKVRASKTPGKTKHFQTIFWTPEVRLADSPGLVLPSLTPFELQAVSSILPISHIPALPAVIQLAGQLLPLERILQLEDLDDDELVLESKKTWRAGMRPPDADEKRPAKEKIWSTGDVMEGWALQRGFLTAKAGRPDVNRAGNHMLRAIAEARIPWSFRPPPSPSQSEIAAVPPGDGIWLGGEFSPFHRAVDPLQVDGRYEEMTDESETSSAEDDAADGSSGEQDGSDDDDESDAFPDEDDEPHGLVTKKKKAPQVGSMFGALEIEELEDSDDDHDDDDDDDEAGEDASSDDA